MERIRMSQVRLVWAIARPCGVTRALPVKVSSVILRLNSSIQNVEGISFQVGQGYVGQHGDMRFAVMEAKVWVLTAAVLLLALPRHESLACLQATIHQLVMVVPLLEVTLNHATEKCQISEKLFFVESHAVGCGNEE